MTKPLFHIHTALTPSPYLRKLIHLTIRKKTQHHFPQIIPQHRLESRFPHQKHGGFHVCEVYDNNVLKT
nr:MAG TPA: hypothetical protein [Caudoviricetes sp.]